MKIKIIAILAALMIMAYGQSEANIIYSFDVTVDYSMIASDWDKIQGVEFTISGEEDVDWEFIAFNAPYDGPWFFDDTGIIDFDWDTDDITTITPLNSGSIFTIRSLDDFVPTITGQTPFEYDEDNFPTSKYSGQLNAIPIPSTILLLGGGLAALVGVRRRRRS